MQRTARTAAAMALAAMSAGGTACTDGARVLATEGEACTAASAARTTRPPAVAGDWWTDGTRPPTVRLVQEGTALRGELAFSGVIFRDGTGVVGANCIALTFAPDPRGGGPTRVLRGTFETATRLRAELHTTGSTEPPLALLLVRQPAQR